MSTTTALRTVQFSEYLLRPYDRRRTELVDGEIVEMAEASGLHVLIIKMLQRLLDNYIEKAKLELSTFTGCGIEIPRVDRDSNVRDPDLVVCASAKFEPLLNLTKAIFLEGNIPELAIEVASPGDTNRDTVDKRIEYALAKVPEYWIINPVDGYVLTLWLEGDDYQELGEFRGNDLILSKLLPGFSPKASDLLKGRAA